MKNFSHAMLLVISLVAPSAAFAVNCNSPPSGFGGSWARAYASWCQQCGGTYNPSNQSCNPGSNWGGGSRPSGGESFYDQEAERQRQEAEYQRRQEEELQRQRELEEQRKREEEAARKQRENFERSKRNALESMKGIAGGELGLKGSEAGELGLKGTGDSGASLGLKETQTAANKPKAKKMECEWGTLGSSVVDLRCLGLDPDKPITVDPHIARGEERAFPAQPDPETFRNASYNQGFAALMRFDAASAAEAIKHFQQARKERPKDPLVRNGLLLAQDIYKARERKEKNDRAEATYLTLQGHASLMTGDNEKARDYLAQARKLAPKDNAAAFAESLAKTDLGAEGAYPARRDAYRLVANGLVSIRHQNLAGAVRMLEAARHLQPEDKFISTFLSELRKHEGRK